MRGPAEKLAPRFRWALAILPVGPSDHLLEVDCGRGIALSLVAGRLRDGTILGIDRSAKMTAAARKRNATAIAAGKVIVCTGSLDTVDLGPRAFDTVFAINVSLFVRDATLELTRLRDRLSPRGKLYLTKAGTSERLR